MDIFKKCKEFKKKEEGEEEKTDIVFLRDNPLPFVRSRSSRGRRVFSQENTNKQKKNEFFDYHLNVRVCVCFREKEKERKKETYKKATEKKSFI